ncbi:MAG: NAD(P)H-dependent oxidoreductase [Spirochaetes bacterium]|nr:NAD(P)H-dependent oxidoreductase [Spirochaetota bacterium]
MKTTIIFAHPWHGSFNKSILETVEKKLKSRGKSYQIIDLNKDKFNPVLREEDLALYSKGKTKDEMVIKYQDMLKETDDIIFIFPVWWYELPAILKGFIDKVMLKNFAYQETSTGLKGLLRHIKKATVITTSEFPGWYMKLFVGNPIKKMFVNTTLKDFGIKTRKWINNDYTAHGKKERRVSFLKKVENLVV